MADPGSPLPVGFWRQFGIFSPLLPVEVLVGLTHGQAAGMVPQLLEKDSHIKLDIDQGTWIASGSTIGALIGSCLSGGMSDTFGRMRVVQASYFFFAVGFAMMVGANSFILLTVGRVLSGIGIGSSCACQVYLSESSHPAYRGMFLAFFGFTNIVGIECIYVVGVYLPWNVGAAAAFFLSVVGLILTLFLYDSPVWLVKNNDMEAAWKSLKLLEGSTNIDARLKEIQEVTDRQTKTKFNLSVFTAPTVWKPFVILCIMAVLLCSSGSIIVVAYTVLFTQEFHSGYDLRPITVAVGVVMSISFGLTTYCNKVIARKTMGGFSGFSSAAAMWLLYAFLKFQGGIPFLHENSWIPLGLFLVFIFTMNLGITSLVWVSAFEMFPLNVRGMMAGVIYSVLYLLMFISEKSYNFLIQNLTFEGVILMFASSSFLFGLFSVTILVETHNKTLEEIEEAFKCRKRAYEGGGGLSLDQMKHS